MLWFQGSVAEAIGEAKSRKAIFVVYIHGNDEQSNSMNNTFTSPDVCKKLETDKYVAVKLESNSETCRQFSQIYPVVLIPSTYFIGENGLPLEIIGGYLSPEDFMTKLNNIAQASGIEDGDNITEISDMEKSDKKPLPVSVCHKEPQQQVPSEPHVVTADQTVKEDPVPRLDAEVRETIKHEEVSSPKDSEILQQKKSPVTSKKNVNDTLEGEKPVAVKKEVKEPSHQESNTTRLQLRLPDGSSLTQQFSADDTLDIVRKYLLDNAPHLNNFRLSTPFPRREYVEDDYFQSLRDLQLTPCAVVLVMPDQQSIISSSNRITSIVWMLLGPFVAVYNYVRSALFGSADNNRAQQNQNKYSDNNTSYERSDRKSSQRTDRPSTAYRRKTDSKSSHSSTFVRKDGNLHRIVNEDDDDDDKTWNGNSTQQM